MVARKPIMKLNSVCCDYGTTINRVTSSPKNTQTWVSLVTDTISGIITGPLTPSGERTATQAATALADSMWTSKTVNDVVKLKMPEFLAQRSITTTLDDLETTLKSPARPMAYDGRPVIAWAQAPSNQAGTATHVTNAVARKRFLDLHRFGSELRKSISCAC
jgi:hypothetical protein